MLFRSALSSVGKSIAGKIDEIRKTGTSQELTELLSRTPEGLLEMLQIKGIGPKKVRVIWQELGITDNRELLLACENGEVAKLKGFGDKIQATIKESILYAQSNTGKLRMEKGEELAQLLFDELEKHFQQVEIVGDVRRKNEVVESIQLVVASENISEAQSKINTSTLPNDASISSVARVQVSPLPLMTVSVTLPSLPIRYSIF